ncbi:MAG: amino acid ABC transporter ATP-binding protein [Deltaproteobacteria bacterium]|nr:amino acid ABC transporter ATP-binding protein [Deltaproteobacteria bacterium]
MIDVVHLTKRFGDRTVLDDLTLHFDNGEVASVVGPSGGGKSTFLRCLNGLETFDLGSVQIGPDKLEAGGLSHAAIARIRQRVGFVFQQWHLFAHQTALENVIEAPIHVKKVARATAIEKAKALLAKVEMSHREHAYPRELSGGEQQRVAIARALAMEPDALLMDEPTSALDPSRVGDLVALLGRLAKEGLTLVIVTHDYDFARAVCTRSVALESGKVVRDGKPSDVLAETPL